MKRIIFAFGVLGLIGCFLPLGLGVSFVDLRHFDGGWHVWLVLAAFTLAMFVGATESEKTTAIVGTVSFGYLTYKFGTGLWDLVFHASLGGIMMGVAIIAGLATSLLALAARTPDPTSRR